MTDERGIFNPNTKFKTECHLCDWQSELSGGPSKAKNARFEHVNDAHPDANINWWADAPGVEIVDTEGEDE